MPLPITNARLLSISGGGKAGGYRTAPAADTEKWEGNVGALVEEKIRRVGNDGQLTRIKETSIIIPGDLRPPVEIKVGDTVHYKYQGAEYDRQVATYEGTFGIGPKIVEIVFKEIG